VRNPNEAWFQERNTMPGTTPHLDTTKISGNQTFHEPSPQTRPFQVLAYHYRFWDLIEKVFLAKFFQHSHNAQLTTPPFHLQQFTHLLHITI